MSSKDAQAPSKRKKSSFSSLVILKPPNRSFFTNRGGIIAAPGKFTRRSEVIRMRFAVNLKKNLSTP